MTILCYEVTGVRSTIMTGGLSQGKTRFLLGLGDEIQVKGSLLTGRF